MNKEDLKFRYFAGENRCPTQEPPFKDGPYILKTFWELERYVYSNYDAEKIIETYQKLIGEDSEFYSEYLKDLNVPDGQKAVFITCCKCVDTTFRGIDKDTIDLYFTNGFVHPMPS